MADRCQTPELHVPWNKGIDSRITITCLVCGKELKVKPCEAWKSKYCSRKCYFVGRNNLSAFKTGSAAHSMPHTEETKCKISQYQQTHMRRGIDHPNYIDGGQKTERHKAMTRCEYRNWRKSVFERDNYTCQNCGQHGGHLQADHIKPWWLYPKLRYELANGRTLCIPCHKETGTWGSPSRNMVREVCYG